MTIITDPDKVVMPFGKYKGEYIGDLPITYLEWLSNHGNLSGLIKQTVEEVLEDYYENGI